MSLHADFDKLTRDKMSGGSAERSTFRDDSDNDPDYENDAREEEEEEEEEEEDEEEEEKGDSIEDSFVDSSSSAAETSKRFDKTPNGVDNRIVGQTASRDSTKTAAKTEDFVGKEGEEGEPDFPLTTDAGRLAYIEYYLQQNAPKERHFKCKLCFDKAFLNCYKVSIFRTVRLL